MLLAGVHVGCFELFGRIRVRTIRDLEGQDRRASPVLGRDVLYLSIMTAYVGVDPRKDIKWVEHSARESIALLAAGKVDAFMAFRRSPRSCGPGRSGTG